MKTIDLGDMVEDFKKKEEVKETADAVKDYNSRKHLTYNSEQ